ncbi:SP_1767 family glycosyltransferase [Bacteroidota bacterium]
MLDIRYGKAFKWPRKLFKYLLSSLYPLVIRRYPLPKVLSIRETLHYLLNHKASICRFGDSEFLYLIEGRNLPYQEQDERLREYMAEILGSEIEGICVGLPIGYYSLDNLKPETKITWRSQISWVYPGLRKFLKPGKTYFNASMTRLYMDYEDTSESGALFKLVMQLWEGRDVLLIEGEKSRLGVGNDLFLKARSVRRILGPAHNSFRQFDRLLEAAKEAPKTDLILIAMGPTAKPLAFELAKLGYQALDIGNVDIEYEWFLRGMTKKEKIPGKYTSEAVGGRVVEDIKNDLYHQQVIARFLND